MPYTYYIFHIPTNQHYYGARWAKNCHPDDFWVDYFTSSKTVKDLIEIYGIDSFKTEIRRTFKTAKAAKLWEHKVLKKIKAVERNDWLNKANGQPPICNYSRLGQGKGRKLSQTHKDKISNGNMGKLKGRQQTDEHIKKAALTRVGRIHSNETKKKMSATRRKIIPEYTFKRGDEIFVGSLPSWAEHYNINRGSAAARFSSNKPHKGWVRGTQSLLQHRMLLC